MLDSTRLVLNKRRSVPRSSPTRAILQLVFIVSSGGFLLQLVRADREPLRSSSSNYLPRTRPDFDLHDIPCDLSRPDTPCTLPGKAYPWLAINSYMEDNKALIKRMYGDHDAGKQARLRAQGPMSRQGRLEKDKPDGFVNACPSEQFVVTPFWANNSAGTTLALVNFQPFEQAVQQEVCKPGTSGRCRDGCRCEQKYSWYRLLAFDPRNECRGIFMDWFQFPSCCACHCYELDPSTNAESHPDLPLPKMVTPTSPAPVATSTPSNSTPETDFDYENDTEPSVTLLTSLPTTPPTSTLATTTTVTATTKVTTTATNTTTSATPPPALTSPAPGHAAGVLKFPYPPSNRTDYIAALGRPLSNNATAFRRRLVGRPTTTPLPALPQATADLGGASNTTTPSSTTSGFVSTTSEGAENVIPSGRDTYLQLWKSVDPAKRKNRVPRI
ncbi:uncharacterized protein LOC129582906 [Paramacrobiotus metropolitanus]|uniref:uncharacterized protein LOC129582906 n=1 Tax=Paramacrobiotus metropolitanus TaxID=2943436 RepID=UPI0024456ECB|nr:uncharacterized protein LOC129582906 [Paramacrobiotus metropolitanus]